MSFSLFHRPGTVVFLDDDPDYLEMLALVLPRHWHVKLFLRPAECINYLQQEPPFWEADTWNQQQIVDQWRDGKPLVSQLLSYWSKYTERYALTSVCVFDYSMPAMDGLTALAELKEWPGSRVLLTGQADEQVAVRAFNQGLIDQFIAKQEPDISRRLIESVEHLLGNPNARHDQIWRATLNQDQSTLLRTAAVTRDLTAYATKRWLEWIVIGDPFGVLGMDMQGRVTWLQLETRDGLKALAELAELEGVAPEAVAEIRAGDALADLELRQSLGRKEAVRLNPAFTIGDGGQLFGAAFEIDAPHCPQPANSYQQWLTRQERRSVQG